MAKSPTGKDIRLQNFIKNNGHFAAFLKHLKRREYSLGTLVDYADVLRIFQTHLKETDNIDPRHITAADLEDYQIWLATEHTYNNKHLSKGTQGKHIAILRSFYKFLDKENIILSNPASNLRSPKTRKRIHLDILTIDELNRLLDQPDDSPSGQRDSVAIRLMALSGLRLGEAIGLDVDNISLPDRELTIRNTKTKRDRLAFFDKQTRELLSKYLVQGRPYLASQNEIALLISTKNNRMQPNNLQKRLNQYVKAAKIKKPVSPHSLRRTFCTLLLQAGVNLKVISELAGHERLSTTAKYTKISIAELSAIYNEAHPRNQL